MSGTGTPISCIQRRHCASASRVLPSSYQIGLEVVSSDRLKMINMKVARCFILSEASLTRGVLQWLEAASSLLCIVIMTVAIARRTGL